MRLPAVLDAESQQRNPARPKLYVHDGGSVPKPSFTVNPAAQKDVTFRIHGDRAGGRLICYRKRGTVGRECGAVGRHAPRERRLWIEAYVEERPGDTDIV